MARQNMGDFEEPTATFAAPRFTNAQYYAVVYIPRVTGTLSILGSAIILYQIICFKQRKRSLVKNRLLFAMSSVDIINSLALALATAPIPRDTLGVYGAVGTSSTCTIQGATIQLGFAVPMYNVALCLYYLLVIRYSKTDEEIMQFVEPAFHCCIFLFSVGVSVAGVILDLYHSNGAFCWIEPYPYYCVHNDNIECTRAGKEAYDYQWWFAGVPLAFSLFSISVSMIIIFVTVHSQETAMKRHSTFTGRGGAAVSHQRIERKMQRTRAVVRQALMYVGCFLATYFFSFLSVIQDQMGKDNPFAISALVHAFLPLQGFLNFVVYIQLRCIAIRRNYRDQSSLWVLHRAMFPPRMPANNPVRALLSNSKPWSSFRLKTHSLASGIRSSINSLSRKLPRRSKSAKNDAEAPVENQTEKFGLVKENRAIPSLTNPLDKQENKDAQNTLVTKHQPSLKQMGSFAEDRSDSSENIAVLNESVESSMNGEGGEVEIKPSIGTANPVVLQGGFLEELGLEYLGGSEVAAERDPPKPKHKRRSRHQSLPSTLLRVLRKQSTCKEGRQMSVPQIPLDLYDLGLGSLESASSDSEKPNRVQDSTQN